MIQKASIYNAEFEKVFTTKDTVKHRCILHDTRKSRDF